MDFRRIESEHYLQATLVRFRLGYQPAGAELRDELTRVAEANRGRVLVVDFGEYQYYPAEVLGCLAQARGALGGDEPLRCVNMPVRLAVASKFLQFDGSILQHYSTLSEALAVQGLLEEPATLIPSSWTYVA